MGFIEHIRSIALVGAGGRMGAMIAEKAVAAGIEVRPLEKPLSREAVTKAVDKVDLLLISVPIQAMEDVVDTVAPLLDGRTILADLCSVKYLPVKLMTDAYKGPVVGLHPLFGPVLPEGFDPRVAVVKGRGINEMHAVAEMVENMGFDAMLTTSEKHDKAMAYIQGLNFVTTVSYLSTIRDFEDVRDFITPSLVRRLNSSEKMVTEDGSMFVQIFEANPFMQEAIRYFRSHLNVAAGGDVDLLSERACWWWWRDQDSGGEV